MLNLNRDSIYWWLGMVGGLAMAFEAHWDIFPWVPQDVQRVVEVVAFITAVVSGKLATSPLPPKDK